jgi:hypothetical protein
VIRREYLPSYGETKYVSWAEEAVDDIARSVEASTGWGPASATGV